MASELLTTATVKALKPKEKRYLVNNGTRLYLSVREAKQGTLYLLYMNAAMPAVASGASVTYDTFGTAMRPARGEAHDERCRRRPAASGSSPFRP